VPPESIALLQRAIPSSVTSHAATTRERKLALGSAILTGSLKMTKRVERTATEPSQTREALLVIQRRDGGLEVVLSEQRLDYRFLGAELQPTSHDCLEPRSRASGGPRRARGSTIAPRGPASSPGCRAARSIRPTWRCTSSSSRMRSSGRRLVKGSRSSRSSIRRSAS